VKGLCLNKHTSTLSPLQPAALVSVLFGFVLVRVPNSLKKEEDNFERLRLARLPSLSLKISAETQFFCTTTATEKREGGTHRGGHGHVRRVAADGGDQRAAPDSRVAHVTVHAQRWVAARADGRDLWVDLADNLL